MASRKTGTRSKRPKKTERKSLLSAIPLYYVLVGGALVVLVMVLVAMRFAEDPEIRAIRRLIKEGAQAVMDEDVEWCLSILDETYTDNQGNDYEGIREQAHDAGGKGFDDVSDIKIKIRNIEVELAPNRTQATAKFEMKFTAHAEDHMGRKIPIIGLTGDHNPFGGVWDAVILQGAKRAEQWQITRLDVSPVTK